MARVEYKDTSNTNIILIYRNKVFLAIRLLFDVLSDIIKIALKNLYNILQIRDTIPLIFFDYHFLYLYYSSTSVQGLAPKTYFYKNIIEPQISQSIFIRFYHYYNVNLPVTISKNRLLQLPLLSICPQ